SSSPSFICYLFKFVSLLDALPIFSELLAKAVNQGQLDQAVSADDRELLIESLRSFGVLNDQNEYAKSIGTSEYRGFEKQPGGGVDRKSTRLNSSHVKISYAVFCLK